MKMQKLKQSPTLNTILMVEDVLKNADSVISIPELKRRLPRKVNHNMLIIILEYLEKSNKIVFGLKGITWLETSPQLNKIIQEGSNFRKIFRNS